MPLQGLLKAVTGLRGKRALMMYMDVANLIFKCLMALMTICQDQFFQELFTEEADTMFSWQQLLVEANPLV
jgi:hypothetical protein